MLTVIKWIFTVVIAALAWLVTKYTLEYFKPYNRKEPRL